MKKKDIIFIVILIIVVLSLYWKTLDYEYIWDSKVYLQQNILLIENPSLWTAFKFSHFREQLGISDIDYYYRPLFALSFMVENKLWGIKSANLRLTNLVIYILSLIFLYVFFKYQSEKKYFPEIATLLFALYPLNVDNVVWIVGRNDLFLLLWASLTFLFLEFFIKKRKFYFLICSSFFYLIGVLSKESFLYFLPILFLYEIVKRRKITIPYHLSNAILSIFFFILKNKILGIKNLSLVFYSDVTENIKVALASLGYYFRSIIFSFYYDMFLPLRDVTNLLYFSLGILFILSFILLLLKSRRDNEIIVPLSFILFFTSGHLLLLYTNLFPFKLYSRYMMLPALGFIWIFAKYVSRIKGKVKLYLVLIIILLFIPSVLINSGSFKNELTFFKRAHSSSPEDGHILYQIANAYHQKKDYLSSELYLNKALSYGQRKENAMLLSLLYADIEMRKADYEKVFRWIENVENFGRSPYLEVAPFIRFQINHKKAVVYLLRGEVEQAEKLLNENIERYRNKKEFYSELYKMYVGHNMWEKAKNLEKIMKERFPSLMSLDVIQIKGEFDSLPTEEKIGFYIRHRNLNAAISIIKTLTPLELERKIILSKLYYWTGREREAQDIINEIIFENPGDFLILNTVGNFYLKELIRVKDALFYFKKSLEINKNQPELVSLVDSLTDGYLNKLKNLWE